jgi:hypothetical protein
LKTILHKRAGGVAQGVSPEFKPSTAKKKKKKERKVFFYSYFMSVLIMKGY